MRRSPFAFNHGTGAVLLLAAALLPAGFSAGRAAESHEGRTPAIAQETAAGDTITYRVTNGNNIALTIFNNGFFGNNFQSPRFPSFEYPAGSDIEHMVRGGLWVGGLVDTSGVVDTLVSTATIDGSYGSVDQRTVSEFTPLYPGLNGFVERSLLPNSQWFSPEAKSEQDFLLSLVELPPNSSLERRPLGVRVDMETLLFSFEPFDAIILATFSIVNVTDHPISGLCAGFYSELATGYKDPNRTNPFSGWFGQKDIAYVDSLRLCSEHHFLLDDGLAPSWCGIQLLGTRPTPLKDTKVSFNWWNWTSLHELAPQNDAERYRILVNGSIDATAGSEAPNNDPVEIVSCGPFPLLAPGDSVQVSFAFLGGEPDARSGRTAEQDLAFNARWAQTAFDLNFKIPVPPPSPDLAVVPGHNRITLRWKADPERFIDPKSHKQDFEGYRVYIGESRLESQARRVMEADIVDSVFYNTGLAAIREDAVVGADSFQYRYDIDGLRDGFKYWVSVTSFDSGEKDIGSLESGLAQNRTFVIPGSAPQSAGGGVRVFPNPYRGDAAWDGSLGRDRYLWFTNLPPRCTIRIYTLAGDLVKTIPFDGSSYHATDIRGIYDPSDPRNPESDLPTLSGGMAAWDLVSQKDQGVASGLYIFSVVDEDTGHKELGKFLILK